MTIGFLIPLSIGMGLAGLVAFFWALGLGVPARVVGKAGCAQPALTMDQILKAE